MVKGLLADELRLALTALAVVLGLTFISGLAMAVSESPDASS